jgi:hypothetical protein
MPTFLHVGCGCRGHDCFDLWALATKGPMEEAALRVLAAAHFPAVPPARAGNAPSSA